MNRQDWATVLAFCCLMLAGLVASAYIDLVPDGWFAPAFVAVVRQIDTLLAAGVAVAVLDALDVFNKGSPFGTYTYHFRNGRWFEVDGPGDEKPVFYWLFCFAFALPILGIVAGWCWLAESDVCTTLLSDDGKPISAFKHYGVLLFGIAVLFRLSMVLASISQALSKVVPEAPPLDIDVSALPKPPPTQPEQRSDCPVCGATLLSRCYPGAKRTCGDCGTRLRGNRQGVWVKR